MASSSISIATLGISFLLGLKDVLLRSRIVSALRADGDALKRTPAVKFTT